MHKAVNIFDRRVEDAQEYLVAVRSCCKTPFNYKLLSGHGFNRAEPRSPRERL